MKFENGMRIQTSGGAYYDLNRWTKNGNDRVYLNDGHKKSAGYVDLVTGEVIGGNSFLATPNFDEAVEMIKEMFELNTNEEETVEESAEVREMVEKVMVYGMNEEVEVNTAQETFVDEETGYEIYITEDGRWIAEDNTIGEWVQIKG